MLSANLKVESNFFMSFKFLETSEVHYLPMKRKVAVTAVAISHCRNLTGSSRIKIHVWG
jgi:hypothetical protein